MATMIQIRNVPSNVHRRIKARAALEGMTLSDYLLRELKQLLERPTREELLERIARLPSVSPRPTPAEVVRAERDRP
jgi:plasmid stability protein